MLVFPMQVDVLRPNRPFTVSSLCSWIREELRALFARDTWRRPPENWNAVTISLLDLSPPLLAGAERLCVPDATGQVSLAVSASERFREC